MWGEYCAGQINTAARLGMAMYFLCFTLHDTPIQYITYYIDRTSLIALTSSVFSGPFQFSVCFSFGLFSNEWIGVFGVFGDWRAVGKKAEARKSNRVSAKCAVASSGSNSSRSKAMARGLKIS
jgi:hypothetical protein